MSAPPCSIAGTPDMYGLGIRVSFYLLWLSTLALEVLDQDHIIILHVGELVLDAAVLLGLIMTVSSGYLQAVEVYIIILLLSATAYLFFPRHVADVAMAICPHLGLKMKTRSDEHYGSGAIVGGIRTFYGIFVIGLQLWFWTSGIDSPEIHRMLNEQPVPGCQQYGFLFGPIDLRSTTIKALNILLMFVALLGGFVVEWYIKSNMIVSRDPRKIRSRWEAQKWLEAFGGLIVATTVIIAIELTIHWNRIPSNVNQATTAAQLIPLLLVVCLVATFLYGVFNSKSVGRGGRSSSGSGSGSGSVSVSVESGTSPSPPSSSGATFSPPDVIIRTRSRSRPRGPRDPPGGYRTGRSHSRHSHHHHHPSASRPPSRHGPTYPGPPPSPVDSSGSPSPNIVNASPPRVVTVDPDTPRTHSPRASSRRQSRTRYSRRTSPKTSRSPSRQRSSSFRPPPGSPTGTIRPNPFVAPTPIANPAPPSPPSSIPDPAPSVSLPSSVNGRSSPVKSPPPKAGPPPAQVEDPPPDPDPDPPDSQRPQDPEEPGDPKVPKEAEDTEGSDDSSDSNNPEDDPEEPDDPQNPPDPPTAPEPNPETIANSRALLLYLSGEMSTTTETHDRLWDEVLNNPSAPSEDEYLGARGVSLETAVQDRLARRLGAPLTLADIENLLRPPTPLITDEDVAAVMSPRITDDDLKDLWTCQLPEPDFSGVIGDYYTQQDVDFAFNKQFYSQKDVDSVFKEWYTPADIQASMQDFYTAEDVQAVCRDFYTTEDVEAVFRPAYGDLYTAEDVEAVMAPSQGKVKGKGKGKEVHFPPSSPEGSDSEEYSYTGSSSSGSSDEGSSQD